MSSLGCPTYLKIFDANEIKMFNYQSALDKLFFTVTVYHGCFLLV